MSKNKRKNRPGNENLNKSTVSDTNITPAADFDPYNDDKTKEIVGSLFDEFVEDGGTNYFADYTDPFLDVENEDKESLGESISRRRKRSVAPAKKSIVFRMKPKKKKSEEVFEDDDLEDDFPADDDMPIEDDDTFTSTSTSTSTTDDDVDEPIDMEKTIILPKLSNFFKKNNDNAEDSDEDEDEDDFFSELSKKSEARSQAAASKEDEENEEEISYESRHAEEAPVKKRRSKNIFADLESPYDTGLNKDSNDDDDDDDYDEKIVEINLMRTLGAALVVIFVVVIIALCVKNHSLSKQLNEANATITDLRKNGASSTLSTSLEELQAENESLKAENESLKGGSSDTSDDHAAAVEILGDTGAESTTASSSGSSASTSTGSTKYTVVSGDSIAKISKKQYGSEAYVDQILQANGLTESSQLQIGQELNLPTINQ
jgi:LysM repeat protein